MKKIYATHHISGSFKCFHPVKENTTSWPVKTLLELSREIVGELSIDHLEAGPTQMVQYNGDLKAPSSNDNNSRYSPRTFHTAA